MPLSFPDTPWTCLGTDLFELDRKTYLVVVDYIRQWFEVRQLHSVTASEVIRVLCELFGTPGIPDTVISDNANQAFKEFARDWRFIHFTSSPIHPQANGGVKRAVQTAKNILRKNCNPYLGLLANRTAPLRNGFTPSQLLTNRKLCTKLPVVAEVLKPAVVDRETVDAKEEAYREKYAKNYNSNHRVVALPALQEGDKVYIRDQQRFGEVKGREVNPRSYKVETEMGTTLRRNRRSLIHIGERADEATDVDNNATNFHQGDRSSPTIESNCYVSLR